ncbi:hypothetical protein KIMH_12260 [Bombiscardovia apis]|uniref:DUF5067 domain-containing protein n=1 Tax=Bombiscardovia apis TaxID=2932182 RepID=A0ABM8BEA1_9BIFI|nr:hypothetical protein [Bombiscardovia apis]BDR55115.1 hypothetical protein KIMH_12260 [Bombiscardovia apis]
MPDNKPNVEAKSQSVVVRRRRLALVIGVAVVVILVLFSAYVWPHWAAKSTTQAPAASQTGAAHPSQPASKPTITAQPLPANATDLLKAMPDSVGAFARVKADAATDWAASAPIEEYTIAYSTGSEGKDVALHVAQWSHDEDADKHYQSMLSSLTGKELASGKVKVSGKETGSYVEREDPANAKQSVVLWRNATVTFRLEGPKASVEAFYKDFPL